MCTTGLINKSKVKYFAKKDPFIIAEIASAHDGNIKKLIKIIDLALKTGADAIKFQIFKTKNFISLMNPMFNEFLKIEINYRNWEKVFQKYKRYKKRIIVEPYDTESLRFCISLDLFSAIKVPTSCLDEVDYINLIKKINKPIILGVGGIELKRIKKIYTKLNSKNSEIVLMYGFQNFPTKLNDINLNKIKFLKNNFQCLIGYADHTDSEDYFFANYIPIIANTYGADVIEKHITINRIRKGRDYYSALNPDEFKKFVNLFKIKSLVNGNKKWSLNKSEIEYAKFSKKYAVANKFIKKNKKLNKIDISFKRTNKHGIESDRIKKIINKKSKKNIKYDQIIEINSFK